MNRTTFSLCLLVLACVPAATLQAQSFRGAISGAVTDPSHTPVHGAAVAVVDTGSGLRRTAATGVSGEFLVTNLQPGDYRIEVEHDGYRKQVERITLLLNQQARLDIPLFLGARTDAVEVVAAVPLLRTDSVALGGSIDNAQITGLPLDGRNFYELSLLLPGVAPPAPGSAGSVRGDFAVNANGAREDSNNFTLDGIFNGDPKLNGIAVTPPVDAVREFEFVSSTYDASFGRNAGGQVSVVLKSGTNQFHGAVYEFLRNRALDARNFFAPSTEPAPEYRRNQFGASLGGPILRNRTFFFADYEGRRVREGLTRLTNVPTALERAGDFSQSGLYAIDLFTGAPFPGAVIPKQRIHPAGQAVAALYPLPNRSEAGQNFASSSSLRDREDHIDGHLDHRLRPSDDLSVRYSFADRNLYEPFSGPSFAAVPGYGTDVPRRAQNAGLRETHIFAANLLNEFRLGYGRVSAGAYHEHMGNSLNHAAGLPEVSSNPRDFGLSLFNITGYSAIGDESHNPQHSASNIFELGDTLTHVRGRHLLTIGAGMRALRQNAYRDEMSRGFLSFLGLSGNALSEMLQGFPSLTGAARLDNQQHVRTTSSSAFLQDAWRARPSLTLTLGLRYEYNSPPVDAFDRANIYDPATRTLVPAGTAGMPRGGYLPDRNNLAPRVGFAWRPGLGRTVLRGGYGVYFDQSALATGEGLYFNAPYFDFRLYFPLEQVPLTLSDPFPKSFPVALPSSALTFQRNLRTAYTQHWSFGVQQELGRSRVIEIAYAASKGTKLLGARDLNQPAPSARQPNPRPVPQFDDITILESSGNSSYQSLQFRLQQRLARGLTALAAYTYSKSIDDASGFFSSAGDPNFPQDSNNTRAERALSNFDLRHRAVLSYSYQLPFGKGRWRGGWQTFGVWTFQTGRPFTAALLSDLDNSNTGRSVLGFGANDRPNVLRDPALSHPGPDRWFDTTAFQVPPFGQFGNAGRNILTGPSLRNINASLVKNASFSERLTLQFRAEAFNILNHPNLDLPDIFVGSPGFGRIQSAQSPRRLQFGLKLLF